MNNFEQKQKETAKRLGLKTEQLPKHIAIIMDGNGRWAQQRGLPRVAGHQHGGKTVEKITQYCIDIGIESLTLYSFSTENWKRPKAEVDELMALYTIYLSQFRPMLIKNNVKLIHLGRLSQLPADLQNTISEALKTTAANTEMTLAIALNYSGRAELTDAARQIAQKCKQGNLDIEAIDEQCIRNHLYAPLLAEPDLLIRTANEKRVSNFLLWQISYSEFYVSEKFWPDFTENDLDKAILDYAARERKFGDIKKRF
jgi:undecaprenyl diphosphate synthase